MTRGHRHHPLKPDDRILVTGASGFVGSNLVRQLVTEGASVTILTRSHSNLWRLKGMQRAVHRITADLADTQALQRAVKKARPTIIFHLATAGTFGGTSAPDTEMIQTNLVGTRNLIQACKSLAYRCLVNTGSSSEYGPKTEPMRETDRPAPRDMYAITKSAATHYASEVARREKKPIITFRLFTPFGPFDDPRRFLPTTIAAALRGEDLQLADPAIGRDFVYIDDVVMAYRTAVERAAKLRGEVFNIGSGRETTLGEAVKTILELTGSASEPRWHTFPASPQDNPRWQADITKADQLLGWRPRTDFRDGVRQTVAWVREHLEHSGATHHG